MASIGEEFQKRFKTLPEDIQEALTAVASVDTIFAIGKKQGLMVDQIGKMADEIWKVMLGLANPKDFIRNLASALGIESEKASATASDVNAQMFQMVRESLRKMYDATTQEGLPPVPAKEEKVGREKEEKKELEQQDTRYTIRDTKQHVPPMIYPQDKDRFEEEFKKSEAVKPEPLGQLAPPPPAVVPPDNFTYPEKIKEVYRESAASQGGYKGRDPYRESTEE